MSDNIDNKSQEGAIDRTGNEGQESVPDRPLTALEISARNAMMVWIPFQHRGEITMLTCILRRILVKRE